MASPTPRKMPKASLNWWQADLLSSKLVWPLVGVLFLLGAVSVYNSFSVYRVRQEIRADLNKLKLEIRYLPAGVPVDEAIETLDLDSEAPPLIANTPADTGPKINELSNVFGDTFSGFGYIDAVKTDLFWDENMTAFTMPPLFEFKRLKDCAGKDDCGLKIYNPNIQEICLKAGCLSIGLNNRPFFQGRELSLPPETRTLSFRRASLYALGNEWLIGLVAGSNSDEAVWVYRFDGRKLTAIVGAPSGNIMRPDYKLGDGQVAFGGDKDDFIVLYSGYDGRAFRFRDGAPENISRFFGLRVTAGGFTPQIFKAGKGKSAVFYICGLDSGKPKLIKLWNKGDKASGGALDLSNLVFKGFAFDKISCHLSSPDKYQLKIIASSGQQNGLWEFSDSGFDNSIDREASSLNIASGAAQKIKAVAVRAIGLDLPSTFPANGASLEVSNDGSNFFPVNGTDNFIFPAVGGELRWRLRLASSTDNLVSPWFDHLNSLIYFYE